ncbi:MAG: SRPBCC family protein [Dehalococcoidia bacterium]
MSNPPKHVYEVYIRTTPEKLWEAITSPEFTRRYFYGTAVISDWRQGSRCVYRGDNDQVVIDGEVVEVEKPKRLVQTWKLVENAEAPDDPPSRVIWQIEPQGETCKLTLIHDGFDRETKTYQTVGPGWNPVLSGLKTLLETGQPLVIG